MFSKSLVASLFAGLIVSSVAYASPVTLAQSSFSAGDTVVNFNSISNEQLITNQFGGVQFSGALYGMTNGGDTSTFPSNGGGVIASNWLYSAPDQSVNDNGANQGLSFTATFSSLVNEVGFYLEDFSPQYATIEFFNGVTSLGNLSMFNSYGGYTAEFKGFQDSSGFDKIVFTQNRNGENGFFAIDDFTFGVPGGGSGNPSAVPLPAALPLMLSGLGVLGFASRRRKSTAV